MCYGHNENMAATRDACVMSCGLCRDDLAFWQSYIAFGANGNDEVLPKTGSSFNDCCCVPRNIRTRGSDLIDKTNIHRLRDINQIMLCYEKQNNSRPISFGGPLRPPRRSLVAGTWLITGQSSR